MLASLLATILNFLSVGFNSAISRLPIRLSLLSLQDNAGLLHKAGYYFNREFQFGNIKLSLATVLQGFAVLAIAILLSRAIKKLLTEIGATVEMRPLAISETPVSLRGTQ